MGHLDRFLGSDRAGLGQFDRHGERGGEDFAAVRGAVGRPSSRSHDGLWQKSTFGSAGWVSNPSRYIRDLPSPSGEQRLVALPLHNVLLVSGNDSLWNLTCTLDDTAADGLPFGVDLNMKTTKLHASQN